MTTWATTQEVEDVTGVEVTATQLAQAGAVVDIYANRTTAASAGLRNRDLHWLKQATAWQAAWLSQQAAISGRNQAKTFHQDGATVERDNEWSTTLAPLAARALKNLSWKASRSQRIAPVAAPVGASALIDYTDEASDGYHDWAPL
jgi:hypothetical protein